jgi:hypothetical protein
VVLIKVVGDIANPLFFFRTVGKYEFEGTRRGSFAGYALLRGRVLLLATTEAETQRKEKQDGQRMQGSKLAHE